MIAGEREPEKVFCLAGAPAVGKTIVAKQLERLVDTHHVRISKLLAKKAEKSALDTTSYANKIIREGGIRALMHHLIFDIKKEFQTSPRKNLVIDGLYRVHDLNAVKDAFPKSKIYLIYVTAPRMLRIVRFSQRESLSFKEARTKLENWNKLFVDGFDRLAELEKYADIRVTNELQNTNALEVVLKKALQKLD